MRPVQYSINVTLDGCCDHRAFLPNDGVHANAAENIARADAMILGRVTYELMESAWRLPAGTDPADAEPFARTIDAARKYVVSGTLDHVDWNAELVAPADLETVVRDLRAGSGRGLTTGGVLLPLTLARLGLIDEYEFVVHPRLAGHGPTLFAGLDAPVDLTPVGRRDLGDGVTAVRYVPAGSDGPA